MLSPRFMGFSLGGLICIHGDFMARENNEHLFMGHEICQVVMCLISWVIKSVNLLLQRFS